MEQLGTLFYLCLWLCEYVFKAEQTESATASNKLVNSNKPNALLADLKIAETRLVHELVANHKK